MTLNPVFAPDPRDPGGKSCELIALCCWIPSSPAFIVWKTFTASKSETLNIFISQAHSIVLIPNNNQLTHWNVSKQQITLIPKLGILGELINYLIYKES